MTKNNAMRLGSVMLVLALLTMCALSGTFAKYTTSGEVGESTGTVAKWGVKVEAPSTNNTFLAEYDVEDAVTDTSITKSVKSSNGTDKVLAPGTTGTVATPTITGTPEVAVKISYDDSEVTFTGWEVNNGTSDVFYCPVTVTVGEGDGSTISGLNYSSAADFQNAIIAKIKASNAEKGPNTDLSSTTLPAITWNWAISGGTGTAQSQTDAYDTQLGDATTLPTITFNIQAKVEQIN